MKKYIFLVLIIFMCGCSPKYSLEIDGTEIRENVNFVINKDLIKNETTEEEASVYSKDSVNHILNNKLYPLVSSRKKVYKKDIKDNDSYYDIHLNYNYENDELIDSQLLNSCFEKKEITISEDKISIHLTGQFYCLYDNNSSMEFKIHTPNKIESSSLNYNFLTNDFVWTINKDNVDNVDIELTVLTNSKISYYGIRIFVISIIVVALGFLAYVAHKLSKRSDMNEI